MHISILIKISERWTDLRSPSQNHKKLTGKVDFDSYTRKARTTKLDSNSIDIPQNRRIDYAYGRQLKCKRILKELARISPTAPADFISMTFITTYITENISNELFERLSWSSVATACRNASDVPEAKNLELIFKEKGLHEFKKADFAKLVRENITEQSDVSDEIREIINELSLVKIN